jgi:hypothetical protein
MSDTGQPLGAYCQNAMLPIPHYRRLLLELTGKCRHLHYHYLSPKHLVNTQIYHILFFTINEIFIIRDTWYCLPLSYDRRAQNH